MIKYNIYCDIDGCLANFNKRFEEISGLSPKEYEQKHGIKKFWNLIDDQIGVRFWTGIPKMEDMDELWDYIKEHNPILLSAPSRQESSRTGKKIWVENYLPKTKLELCSRKEKQNYSGTNKILIDDLEQTIIEWRLKGGIGIVHTSANNTINELKKLGI